MTLAVAATISMMSCRTQDYSTDFALNNRQEQVQIKVTRSSVSASAEDAVFAKIQVIISDKVAVPVEQIHLNSNFRKDLGFDSLDLIEIIIDIENEFNIAIPDEAVENFLTVEDLVNYIIAVTEPQPPKPDNPYPDLFTKVQDIIQEQIAIPEGLEITLQSNLKTDLGMDSLDIAELIMAVEEEFEIEIPTEICENFITVGNLVVYIAAQQPTDPVDPPEPPGPVISIENRLENIICELMGVTSDMLSPETNLREDLGMDDLIFIDLIRAIEIEFDILMPLDEVAEMRTIDNILTYIKNQS